MKKGFTLLETLIAIAIMTVAVGSAFSMAQKSLQSAYQDKNRVTAYFLAAEGLELVRNVRDNVAFYNKGKEQFAQADWLGPLVTPCSGRCDIDPKGNLGAQSTDIISCDVPGCRLNQISDSGKTIYSSISGGTGDVPSSFYRSITVTKISSSDHNEAVVTSAVTYSPGSPNSFTVSLTETLSDWYQT